MHETNGSDTLKLMQDASTRPCYATLAPLHARLEEIAANLCTLYPRNPRFPRMVEAIKAARGHLNDAQAAAERNDAAAFSAAKARLAASLEEIGSAEIDLDAWHLG